MSDKQASQKRSRPLLSCAQCHQRKIKCDRVKPCGACCLRGTPEQCSLETSDDAQSYISQANEIKRLRKQVADLEDKILRERGGLIAESHIVLPSRSRPHIVSDDDGFSSPFAELQSLCSHLPFQSLCWAEQPFSPKSIPLQAMSSIKLASPELIRCPSSRGSNHPALSRFLACVSPQQTSGVRNWFRAVVEVSPQSRLLTAAVQAIASLFLAMQSKDPSLLQESQRLHVETLSRLRQDIAQPNGGSAYFALYATLILVFYELASLNSQHSWMVHVGGAEKIVKHLGPTAFASGLQHDTFVLFSYFSFTLSIFQRRPTFLSERAWRFDPWDDDDASHDSYASLMQIVTAIPFLLERAEAIQARLDSPSMRPSVSAEATMQLAERIGRVEQQLTQWEHHQSRDDISMSSIGHASNGWAFFSSSDGGNPTFDAPTTLCICYAARLSLARIDRRPHRHQHEQTLQWAVAICHIAQDQMPQVTDAVTAVVYLFSLRVAYETLPDVSNGRKWIESLYEGVAARFGLPLARSLLMQVDDSDGDDATLVDGMS